MSEAGTVFDIAEVLLSEEVRRIHQDGWTGVLALTQGEVAKGLYFVDGEIVFATSTVEEDRLGANLFRNGRITEAQFRAAMAAAQTPGVRLGRALIDAGVLSPAELDVAVVAQVERIILSVFRWSSGRFQRRPMDGPLPEDLLLNLRTPRVLLLGAREILSVQRLEPLLGPDNRPVRRLFQAAFDYDELKPSPAEQAVLAVATPQATLGVLLGLSHPRPQLVRAIYALVAGGLLELVEEAVEAASPRPDDTLRGSRQPQDLDAAEWTPAHPIAPPTPSEHEIDPDLLTPNPPPPSVLPGEDDPLLEELSGYSDQGPDPWTELPADPRDGERRARALLENGRREPALALLRSIVQHYPDAIGARRLLALTTARFGTFDKEVEAHFLAVVGADPGDVEIRYRLATYYRRAGMTAQAVLQLRLVLSADSGHAAAWRDLGELEASSGRR